MKDPLFDRQRKHERKFYSKEIIFSFNERDYRGTMKNISLGGAFIVTGNVKQFAVGNIVTVSIPFTKGKKNVERKGRIQWKNNEGFAIEFF